MLTASGMCASLVAYVVFCVRFVSLVHVCRSRNRLQRSARNATLDTGSWLDLSRQGLSPGKKQQASLVAPITAPIASGRSDLAGWVFHPLENAALARRTPK
jgi:hypothetical protein